MINQKEILETINMIEKENLDIRTITMGISLLDCASESIDKLTSKVYDKVTKKAENLVKVGKQIEAEYGIPIINKRISVTPVSLIGQGHSPSDFVKIAKTLDKAAHTVGVNFIGGFSALVHKGFTVGDTSLIYASPRRFPKPSLFARR